MEATRWYRKSIQAGQSIFLVLRDLPRHTEDDIIKFDGVEYRVIKVVDDPKYPYIAIHVVPLADEL